MNEYEPPDVWLARELIDHLDPGPLGLDELLWLLNGSAYTLSKDRKLQLSSKIARKALENGEVELFLVRWPTGVIVAGPFSADKLRDPSSWVEGTEYFALASVDSSQVASSRATGS